METKIFEELAIRLTASEVTDYITAQGQGAIKDIMWFEDQFEQFRDDQQNKSLPFDLPAIALEFGTTKYKKGNGGHQQADGTFIIHVAQRKFDDGVIGAASLTSFKKMIDYADMIIDLVNAYQFPCSAKPFLESSDRDHVNKILMIDKITFSWSGVRRKPEGVPV
jgi:hypothetical protein